MIVQAFNLCLWLLIVGNGKLNQVGIIVIVVLSFLIFKVKSFVFNLCPQEVKRLLLIIIEFNPPPSSFECLLNNLVVVTLSN